MSPSSTGPVRYCDPDSDPNCSDEHTLNSALQNTIEKYVFFSTDPRYLRNNTKHEQYILDNYARHLPKLMYKVEWTYVRE